MTRLTVEPADRSAPPQRVDDRAAIVARLAGIGVLLEPWTADRPLAPDANEAEILAAYAAPLARLTDRYGFQSVDVVRMHPDHPGREGARARFRAEHTHGDFEVRFFVEGSGCFYLHAGREVFTLVCEAGDLLSVPAGTRHWFDMGERPLFTAIRLFTTPEGWVADFTGDDIAARFPEYTP
jgi:1,2-dihydroxy-3-keto-5-methylthiopentene dioxygenase